MPKTAKAKTKAKASRPKQRQTPKWNPHSDRGAECLDMMRCMSTVGTPDGELRQAAHAFWFGPKPPDKD